MTLKLKKWINAKVFENNDIVKISYTKEKEHFIFESLDKSENTIPIEDIEHFTMDIQNLLVSTREFGQKSIDKMNYIEFNGNSKKLVLNYRFNRTPNSNLELDISKIHYFKGIWWE